MILPGPVGGLIDVAGRAIGDAMQKRARAALADRSAARRQRHRGAGRCSSARRRRLHALSDGVGPCGAALRHEGAVRRHGRLQADRHGRREHCPALRAAARRRPTTSPSSWPTRRPTRASSTISTRATAPARTCCPSCSRSSTASTSPRSPTRACRPACRTCWPTGSTSRWSAPRSSCSTSRRAG